ncbi:MAG: DNA polymerase, partial [Actinomycetota bacterium]
MSSPPLLAVVTASAPGDRNGRADRQMVVVVDDDGDPVLELDAPATTAADALVRLETERSPRWLWWGHDDALAVARLGLRPQRCWDLTAVHRLLHGGWRAGPGHVWAAAHDLDTSRLPESAPVDLFNVNDERDPERAVRDDGYLDPDWADGAWAASATRRRRWAQLAIEVRSRQQSAADAISERPALASTIRSESTAAALAAELEVGGLPVDLAIAESIITGFVGDRPTGVTDRSAADRRDESVLRHVPDGDAYDLRSPEQVKSMLRRCGIEVPDTRSWRLERLVDRHPVVGPLLEWRRAERIDTTFGYRWLDEHVGPAPGLGPTRGRLRGAWSASDGAAGRMTASAGLHNMPAELRPAVVAEPGHVFVRADLGQIEPRILAAVSGDESLARATQEADMYAPVAVRLGVDRDIAKVAVLGAMYGQTTGVGAEALRGLEHNYPVAMALLRSADDAARGGNDLRTYGGRLVRMSSGSDGDLAAGDARARAAARGRYGRNAMVQGAAAEFFKVWALLVRARTGALGAEIVLCLHDELIVHAPADRGDPTA